MAQELHELLEIPRTVLYSSGGFRYEKPLVGSKIIRSIVKAMVEALHRGEEIHIRGFGTFYVKDIPEKHNPKAIAGGKGKNLLGLIPKTYRARKRVMFKPSTHLVAMVNVEAPNVPNYHQRNAIASWENNDN